MARSTDSQAVPCDVLADDLEWYLDSLDGSDGQDEGLPPLPPERRKAVEAHMEGCSACSRQLALAGRLRSELRALPAEIPMEPPAAHILAEPRPHPAPAPWRRAIPWVATAGGALVAVVLALVLVQPLLVPERPEPTAQQLVQAEAEARYALAQLAAVTRRAGRHLQEDVLMEHLVEPTARHLRRSLTAASTPDDPGPRTTRFNPESPNSTTPALPEEPRR